MGMFSLRAGAFSGRLDAGLTRDGSIVRLADLKRRIVRRLCVSTMNVSMVARRIVPRECKATTAPVTLSKGSIRAAIWRAISGLTPCGMNPGSDAPGLRAVAAVDTSADSISLFLEVRGPLRSCPPQGRDASSAEVQQG